MEFNIDVKSLFQLAAERACGGRVGTEASLSCTRHSAAAVPFIRILYSVVSHLCSACRMPCIPGAYSRYFCVLLQPHPAAPAKQLFPLPSSELCFSVAVFHGLIFYINPPSFLGLCSGSIQFMYPMDCTYTLFQVCSKLTF